MFRPSLRKIVFQQPQLQAEVPKRAFATGVGYKADIGAPPLTQLSIMSRRPERRGDGHTGGGLSQSKWSSGHGRKQKGAGALTGLGHGLINWCDDVRFTPESRHSEPTPEMSAFDPKRTFRGL